MIAAFKSWWSRFVARHIVADEPEDECNTCREIHCDERMAAECKLRTVSAEQEVREDMGWKQDQGLRVGKRVGRPTKIVWKEE